MSICYGHFALKSRFRREFLSRGPAWRRGLAGFSALVACGFLAPTALATPSPVATAPLAAASTFDGQVVAAAPTATTSQPSATTPSPDGGATAAADIPPPDPAATATTGQTAGSTATATQQQPVNVVVIVRVNSPGNDGSITQSNIAAAPSTAANNASTSQGGSGGDAASTAQQATSTATATQDAAGNLVVTVRIDSPGENGAVAQTNGVVGSSSGTNTSDTTQQVAAPTPAVLPQAHRAGAAASPKPARRHRPSGHRQLTGTAATESSTPQAATPGVAPTQAAPDHVATRPVPAHRHPAAAPEIRGNAHHRVTLSSIAGGAAKALSPLVPEASPVVAGPNGPQDVSHAVLLTLLMLVVAASAFALVRRAAVRRQAASWRPPR